MEQNLPPSKQKLWSFTTYKKGTNDVLNITGDMERRLDLGLEINSLKYKLNKMPEGKKRKQTLQKLQKLQTEYTKL